MPSAEANGIAHLAAETARLAECAAITKAAV
jgi:hypothetical protein